MLMTLSAPTYATFVVGTTTPKGVQEEKTSENSYLCWYRSIELSVVFTF